ncbi:hypothetical protein [Photobacterium kishitanii]|uniref:Uncharacterized protein n=1 Tax=Photobacterium kishitanii TaxID=318456 RepID=A0A2T3KLA2_9GAMM|nr:hypothetical protein [Photobacterium kishitanii]PSV00430.1 hypothetical protein C9J27_04680 [Photobacterium kishitanii]
MASARELPPLTNPNATEYIPKIKKGSIVRDHRFNTFTESKVISDVIVNKNGQLEFTSETEKGEIINYVKYEHTITLVENPGDEEPSRGIFAVTFENHEVDIEGDFKDSIRSISTEIAVSKTELNTLLHEKMSSALADEYNMEQKDVVEIEAFKGLDPELPTKSFVDGMLNAATFTDVAAAFHMVTYGEISVSVTHR